MLTKYSIQKPSLQNKPPISLLKLLIFSVLCSVAPARAQLETKSPHLLCDAPIYEFGNAWESEIITHDFVIQNKGDTALLIKKIKSSCGCTVASLATNIVPAGASILVTSTVTLKGREGPLVKTVDLYSNDPLQSVYTLTLKGNVTKPYKLIPKIVVVRYTPNEPISDGIARLTFPGLQPIQITSTHSENLDFASVILDTVIPRKEYTITFKLKENLQPTRNLLGTFSILTDTPKAKKIDIPFRMLFSQHITVTPRQIKIPIANLNHPFKQRLLLKHLTSKATEIIHISVPSTNIVVTTSKKSSSLYFLKVGFVDVKKEELEGKSLGIHVKYEGDKNDILNVPIKFIDSKFIGKTK